MRFLGTNVILRYLVRDDEKKAAASYAVFRELERGAEETFTSETHIGEVIFVLSSPRGPYRLNRKDIHHRLLPLLSLRGMRMDHKQAVIRGLAIYASSPLDFEDAMAIAHMERLGIREILSYDRDFDRVAGIVRVEP